VTVSTCATEGLTIARGQLDPISMQIARERAWHRTMFVEIA
jgi:hypothetical protein